MNLINEGKTKCVFDILENPNYVLVEQKHDITYGDGKFHAVIPPKGAYANEITFNHFKAFEDCGIETSLVRWISSTETLFQKLVMAAYEWVARREAHGSELKRKKHLKKGHYYRKVVVQTFLKTTGRKWRGRDLPCDDPLIIFSGDMKTAELWLPDVPIDEQEEAFMVIDDFPFADGILRTPDGREIVIDFDWRQQLEDQTRKAFLVLEKLWQPLGRKVVDFKIEFGVNNDGKIVIGDSLAGDELRMIANGEYQDKQLLRDGGEVEVVLEKYRIMAELSGKFRVPEQLLVFWQKSEDDNVACLLDDEDFNFAEIRIVVVSEDSYEHPSEAVYEIQQLIYEMPDAALIIFGGKNPDLVRQTTVPTFTRSSRRGLKTALRAVLNGFANRNQQLYEMRFNTEKKLPDC
jgi:phosphoribosylaminoimidazole-succinocarboxamide synthase